MGRQVKPRKEYGYALIDENGEYGTSLHMCRKDAASTRTRHNLNGAKLYGAKWRIVKFALPDIPRRRKP
jgi:hypothetical protein